MTGAPKIRQFEIYKLLPENDPFLNIPCVPFDFEKPQINPLYLGMSLFETMFAAKGIGLTANQVGLPYAVFVVGSDMNNKQIFFNPKIVDMDQETVKIMEGCLSFPNLFFKIERPKWITLEYQHVNGEEKKDTFTGMTARVVAHEMDHILGYTMLDHVGSLSVKMAKEKRAKLNKKLERHGG